MYKYLISSCNCMWERRWRVPSNIWQVPLNIWQENIKSLAYFIDGTFQTENVANSCFGVVH